MTKQPKTARINEKSYDKFIRKMEDNMNIKFEVKMTQKIMYNFLLHHAYNSISVLITNVFGVLAAGLGATMLTEDAGKGIMYLVLGIAVIAYTPFSLYLSAKRQIKSSPVFKDAITYSFTEEGLTSSQNEITTEAPWATMIKVVSTSKSIIIYTGKNRATILPKESIGEQYESVVQMISTHMEPSKVKIKS